IGHRCDQLLPDASGSHLHLDFGRSSQSPMAQHADLSRLHNPLRLRRRRRGLNGGPPDDRLIPHGQTPTTNWPRLERRARIEPVATRRLSRLQPSHPPATRNLCRVPPPAMSQRVNLPEHKGVNLCERHSSLGPLRLYCTVRRYMKGHGLVRQPRLRAKGRPGEARAVERREAREIRSYEAEYVGSLWHLDFHHGSLKVLTPSGEWQRPIALGVLDDHSRLCCRLQWYLSETAEDLVHGLTQAIQKRGLPRALLTDNGPAMIADEVREGLLRLGIVHDKTLPYSPYQNGKQEAFWGTLEGRLMEMLDGCTELTL